MHSMIGKLGHMCGKFALFPEILWGEQKVARVTDFAEVCTRMLSVQV